MKNHNLLLVGALSILLSTSSFVHAEETAIEKTETATNKAVDKVKEIYRNSKGELCELINGKMECMAKDAKNKAKTLSDKAKTKAKELKKKAD